MSFLKLYKASAGSGKTFKLTEEFLKLLIANPDSYKNILAVTFTNKATDEMKSRIIGELARLAKNEKSEYLEILKNELKLEETIIKERAQSVITSILHDYSHFSVQTIESFFQLILRSFFKEIGLNDALKIELNTTKVLENAITLFFNQLNKNKQITEWITDFAMHKISEGANWNIEKDFKKLGGEIFKETFLTLNDTLINEINNKELLIKYISDLKKIITEFETYIKKKGDEGTTVISNNGLEITNFFQTEKGPAGFFNKLAKNSFSEPNKYVLKANESPENWAAKNNPKRLQIIQLAEHKLVPILNDIIEYVNSNKTNYYTAKQILNNIHTLGILSDLLAKARKYSFENSLFLLSDGTKLLKEIINDNETPFIYEKAGVWYKHIMIDEFQDTSGLQWNNFKPLILNSLSENGFNLIVGDVKQSIYRWRNGDWQLLAEKLFEDIKPFEVDDHIQLNTNWRSSKNIVTFNNFIFKHAPNILEKTIATNIETFNNNLNLDSLKGKITNAYKNVLQKISTTNDNKEGYIELNFYQDISKKEWEQEVLKTIPNSIHKLKKHDYELKDIVILVRKKYQAKLIVDYIQKFNSKADLRNESSYPVVSDEALYLSNSTVINFLVSCILFLNDPRNDVNNLKLISDYKLYIKNEQEFPIYNEYKVETILPDEFIQDVAELNELPLFDIVEKLIQIFRLNKISGQLSYLIAFQDAVNEFSKNYTADKLQFIEWWENEGKSKTLTFPADLNAVRIMTIHKAKGLEFKGVIIPFLNWSIDHEKNPIIWCKPTENHFSKIPILPMKYKNELASTIFCKDYFNEKILAFVDNLNLLYVALTRAKSTLIINGILKSNSDKIVNVSDLVYSIIKSDKEINLTENIKNENDIKQIQFNLGQLQAVSKSNKNKTNNELVLKEFYSNYPYSRLKIKQTGVEFYEKQAKNSKQAINYGKLMHKILEKIMYKKDIEEAVKEIYAEGFISESEINSTIQKINSYLNQPEAKNWFTDNLQIKNETSILLPDGSLHRPDRIIINKDEIIIIDYKFTKEESSKHKIQLKEYADILQTMNYKHIKAYLWYPEKQNIVKV